jgi:hypothetical protein
VTRHSVAPPAATTGDSVNLAQIARMAWTGRAAVAKWRRRYDDFPPAVGGTDTSPLFERGAAENWLRVHQQLPDFTIPTAAERAGARLTALQLVRTVVPGVLTGTFVNTYEAQAPDTARTSLALLRDYTKVATLTELAPIVLELGHITVAALANLNHDRDRVDAWLTTRTRAIEESGRQIGDRSDLAAVDIAMIAAEALSAADRDALYEQHTTRVAQHLWAVTRSAPHQMACLRYEVALSAAWLAAYVLAPALGNDEQLIDAHLDTLARQLISPGHGR